MGKISEIDKDYLRELVKNSNSFASILKEIGLSPRGGNIDTLKKKLGQYGIDYSHISQGKNSNLGRLGNITLQCSNSFKVNFIHNNKNDFFKTNTEIVKVRSENNLYNLAYGSTFDVGLRSFSFDTENRKICLITTLVVEPMDNYKMYSYLKECRYIIVNLFDNAENINNRLIFDNCKQENISGFSLSYDTSESQSYFEVRYSYNDFLYDYFVIKNKS